MSAPNQHMRLAAFEVLELTPNRRPARWPLAAAAGLALVAAVLVALIL